MQKAEATARASETNTVFPNRRRDMRLRRAATSRRGRRPDSTESRPMRIRGNLRDNFIEFLPETVLVADRLVPQV